jgi:hypothetical protein
MSRRLYATGRTPIRIVRRSGRDGGDALPVKISARLAAPPVARSRRNLHDLRVRAEGRLIPPTSGCTLLASITRATAAQALRLSPVAGVAPSPAGLARDMVRHGLA